jgi:hypothetical protein
VSNNRASANHEGILLNKNEKSPITAHPQPIAHPKLATIKPKDEVELAKQHQQQVKTAQQTLKSNVPAASAKKPTVASMPNTVKQQEQPFTTVVHNRNKGTAPAMQQQNSNKNGNSAPMAAPSPTQQQQVLHKTVSTASVPIAPPTAVPVQQQQPPAPAVQHEPLVQRQSQRQVREAPTQVNGFNKSANLPAAPPTRVPMKISELIKGKPLLKMMFLLQMKISLQHFPIRKL